MAAYTKYAPVYAPKKDGTLPPVAPPKGVIPVEPAILTPGALKWFGKPEADGLLDWQEWLDTVGEVEIDCGGNNIRYVLNNGYIMRSGTNLNNAGSPWALNLVPLTFVAAPLPVVGEKWFFHYAKPSAPSIVLSRKTSAPKGITLLEDIDD